MRAIVRFASVLLGSAAQLVAAELQYIETEPLYVTEQRTLELAWPTLPDGKRPDPVMSGELPNPNRVYGNVVFRVVRDASAAPAYVTHVQILKAVTDKNELLDNGVFALPSADTLNVNDPSPDLRSSVAYSGSRRATKSMATIEGELELYAPSSSNGALRRLENVNFLPGTRLSDAILDRFDISIRYEAQPLAFVVYIRDPNRRLFRYEFQDAAGNRIPMSATGGSGTGDGTRVFRYRPITLPRGASIVLQITTPESLRHYAFRLRNVALP